MEFGFVGAAYEAGSPTQDAQQLINYYPEVDPAKSDGERGVIALYPTPGLNQVLQLDMLAEVRGMYVLPGGSVALVACGNTLYSITSAFVPSIIGTLLSSTGPVSISDNGTSAYIADGANRYYYTWGTATFAVVSDGAFNGANTADIVDNYLVYNNPNSNQWGCTNVSSIVSSALNFAATLSAPGNVVGLICDHRQAHILSEYTLEVWTDVGSFPFPFQIIPGSTMQHGCGARGSISRLGEGFAFLAQDRRGKATVVMVASYQAIRISTHAIEDAINSYSVINDAISYTYQANGHEFYVITFPSADVTWVFDIATKLWHRRAWRDTNNVLHRHRSNCGMFFANSQIVGDFENGKLYQMTDTAFTDNGDPILRRRACRHLTDDLKRVFHNDLQIQFQPGVGTQSGQGIDPKCILRWSDDGGFTYGTDHVLTIGRVGKYKHRAIKRRLGYSRDRIYEMDMSDPVYSVVVSANLNIEKGDN